MKKSNHAIIEQDKPWWVEQQETFTRLVSAKVVDIKKYKDLVEVLG